LPLPCILCGGEQASGWCPERIRMGCLRTWMHASSSSPPLPPCLYPRLCHSLFAPSRNSASICGQRCASFVLQDQRGYMSDTKEAHTANTASHTSYSVPWLHTDLPSLFTVRKRSSFFFLFHSSAMRDPRLVSPIQPSSRSMYPRRPILGTGHP
jgi:hypothetical protein